MLAGDFDAVSRYLVPDAVWLPAGGPAVNGKSAVIEYRKQNRVRASLKVTPVKIEATGHVGTLRGIFSFDTEEGKITGKMAQGWRRGADGEWRIVFDIWNFDAPQPPTLLSP